MHAHIVYICTSTHLKESFSPVTLFLPGGDEEEKEETVTISVVYIEPNAAEPTQDSTKDFTPRVETATVREKALGVTPRKPIRTEVRSGKNLLLWHFHTYALIHIYIYIYSMSKY